MSNTDNKNSDWKKKYVIFLAGILVALIIAYVALSIMFGSWNPVQWKGSPESNAINTEQQFQGDDGTQEKPGGNLSADNIQTKPGTDGDSQNSVQQSKPDDGTQSEPDPDESTGNSPGLEGLSEPAQEYIGKVNLLLRTYNGNAIVGMLNGIDSAMSELTEADKATKQVEVASNVYLGFASYYSKGMLTEEVRNGYIQIMQENGLSDY